MKKRDAALRDRSRWCGVTGADFEKVCSWLDL
jgi:hypothetical protein